jgi:hypothetical protein
MSVFVREKEFKRVIFNVDIRLAERLEKAKESSRLLGRKLDVDAAVDKALEKFLKKAEKKIEELLEEQGHDADEGGAPRLTIEAIAAGGPEGEALPEVARGAADQPEKP